VKELKHDGLVKVVTPVKTGVQGIHDALKTLDSGFRRNDGTGAFSTFYERIKHPFAKGREVDNRAKPPEN
jgi:hypothetical protein